jgi:hypothetical protein
MPAPSTVSRWAGLPRRTLPFAPRPRQRSGPHPSALSAAHSCLPLRTHPVEMRQRLDIIDPTTQRDRERARTMVAAGAEPISSAGRTTRTAAIGPDVSARDVSIMPPIIATASVSVQPEPGVRWIQEAGSRFPPKGAVMADKSPRQHLSKKAGKSLKEKRAEKHLKVEAKNKTEIVPPGKKH